MGWNFRDFFSLQKVSLEYEQSRKDGRCLIRFFFVSFFIRKKYQVFNVIGLSLLKINIFFLKYEDFKRKFDILIWMKNNLWITFFI